MNKIFKVIWNHATQMWIVVSELTKSQGKSTNQTDKRQLLHAILISITASGTLLFALPSLAGNQVTGGNSNNPCKLSTDNNLACGDSTTISGGGLGHSNKQNIAIGIGTIAKNLNKGTATAGNIAIGHNVKAIGSASLAMGISTGNYGGSVTIAAGADSYAIGNGASTGGYGTPSPENNGGWKKYDKTPEDAAKAGNPGALGGIAIGSEAWVMGNSTYGIAIGDNATARGVHAMAYGRIAYAKGDYTIAMGTSSNASGNKAISIGNGSQTSGEHALSIGAHTKASGIQSIAIGGSSSRDYAATASGASSISIGEETNSSSDQTVAIGKKANSSGAQAIALGFESKASNAQAIAIGKLANASANQSIAIGDDSKASHEQSIALGKSAQAKADKAIAAGHNAKVESSNAVALGNNITVTRGFDNAVILGSGSATQEGEKHRNVTVNGISYSNFAGHDNVAKGDIVSIGNATHKRQLVNVAPGAITATSTDAVNGSQLYMVADTVANLAKATAAHLGGGSQLSNNNITAPSYQLFTGKSESAQGGNSNTLLTGSPFTNVGAALSGLNEYINKGFTITNNENTTKGVVTPGNTVKFTNGKNTQSNVKQEVDGVTEITFNVENTDLNVNDGKVSVPNNDGAKFVNATTVAKAINNISWKVGKIQHTDDITFNNSDDDVKGGDEVRFADGKFTTVSVGNKDTNGKTTNVIKVDVDAQKVVEASQTPVVYTDKQGNKVIKKGDKFVKENDPTGMEIDPQNVIASINNGSNSTKAPMTLGNIHSNLTPDNNSVSAPTSNNLDQNKNNAATVQDILNVGWNLQENGTAKDFVKHGDTVNFKDGRGVHVNITKAANGVNNVKFDTPLTYIEDTGNSNTESTTPTNTVKLVGGNANLPVKLTNLESGLGGQPVEEAAKNNGNNAVNVSDLNTALKAYKFNLGGDKTEGEFEALSATATDDDKQIKKGDTFKLNAGKNIKIKQIADGYEIATKDQIELGKNDPNGKNGSLNVTGKSGAGVKIDGTDGSLTLTGVPNNGQTPSLKITSKKGKKTLDTTDPADGINRITYTTDNGKERQVATMDDGLTFAGDFGADAPRKLGEKLTIKGGETDGSKLSNGNNIGVESNANGTLTVKLAKKLNLGDPNNANNGEVGGLAHNLPQPADTQAKQDAPNNIADKNNHAATVGDVLNAGFNVRGAKTADGQVDDVDFVKPYDTVEFVDGNATDLIVTNTDNKKTAVTVDIKTDNTTLKVENNKLSAITSEVTPTKQNDGRSTFATTTPTALVTAKTVMDVANKLIEEGLVFAGNTANTDIKRPLGTKLTIKGEKTDENDISAKNIYVKADNTNGKNELVINFSEKPEFKELKLAENGKSSIRLNTTGDANSPALTLKGDGNKAVALKNVAAGTITLDGTHRGDKATGPTAIATDTKLGEALKNAYNGLANLQGSSDTNAFTVADAKNLGWIVSAPGNDYAKDVRNANEVRFIGTNMATVTGKTTDDGVREITVDVNAQKVVETAQIPVVYTDKTGKKLIKSPNGKFYAAGTKLNDQGEPENPDNTEVPAENVIASLNDAKGNTTNPTTLANVKSNLADGDNQTSAPESVQLNKNNAATVEDVLNSGWDLLENGNAKDFIKHGDKVNFINGRGTKVTIGVDNGANTIKFDTPLAYVPDDASSNDESTPTNKVKLVGKDNNSSVTLANIASGLGGKSLSEAATETPNNAVNVSDLNQAIDDFNFKLGGEASGGEFEAATDKDCDDSCIKKDETFKLNAGKNIKIKQIANGYEVATKDQITLGSKTANNQEGVDGNLTVTGKEGASVAIDGKDGSITLTGKADNGHTPTVKMGTEKGKSTVDNTEPTDGIDRIVYETRNADGTSKKRQVATMDDGLMFAGDSGTDSPRKLGEKLTIKGGETQTDKLSNNNNIGVVSDGQGNLTIKLAKNLNLSEPNDANNGKISGLGHNLPESNNGNKQGANNPNITAENQHNAATVGDVLNAGWNLQNNGASKDFVKPYDTVNFVDGVNAQLVVTTKEDGTASDVTVNVVGLPVQYTTKDGTPVAKVGDKYYKVGEDGKPITKKTDGSKEDPISATDLITNIINPSATKANEKGNPTTLSNVVSALKPYSETIPTTLNTSKGNLLDLNTKDGNTAISDNNVVTVGDLRKMGWVVSSNKSTDNLATPYSSAVMNAHEVKFAGTGVATVSGKTEGETHTITVDVNAQDAINKAHFPVVYTKSDGTKVVKDPLDGKFYEVNDQGEPDKAKEVQPNEIIASINNPSNDKNTAGKPTTLTNLKGNLNRVNKEGTVTKPDGSPLDPAATNDLTKAPALPDAFNEEHNDYKLTILNNAATIGDVLNAGWNLQGNGKAVDFVKPFDTVNFADGIGTTVDVKASQDGKTNIIKVNTVMAYTDANGNLLKKANDGKYYLPDQVNADGTTKDTAVAVDNPQVNLVNAKDNNTTTPTRLGNVAGGTNTYADKAATPDGQPLVKVGDKYYAPDQFTGGKLNTNAVETPLENGVEPTSNVTKAKSGLADLEHSDPNNVMTVSDAKNMGWIVSADGNDYAKDVRNANEVKFIGGTGISVTGKDSTDNNAREITIAIKEGEVVPSNEYTAEDGKTLIKVGEDFYYKDDIDPTTGKAKPGKNKVSDEIASKAINNGTGFVTGNKVADAIKKSNWTLGKANPDEIAKTAFKFDAGNVEHINPNDNVRFSDGKNTRVALGTVESLDPEGNKITTTTVKFDVDSPIDFKYSDADGKEYVKANNGKFYAKEHVNADGSLKNTAPATLPLPLTEEQVVKLHKGAQLINGLGKDGQANSPYEMQDKIAKGLDDYRKQNQNATPEQIAAETDRLVQANPTQKDTFVKGTGGVNLDNVAWAEKPDQAVNKDQLDQTVNKSGFLVKQNGTSTLTDDANKGSTEDSKTEKVTPNDVVDFVNGTNTSVTATTTRENGRDVTKVRVDVTGMPVTYTDKEGNKVAKIGEHYYKVDPNTGLPKVTADGSPDPTSKVEDGNVIASMVNPNGKTKDPTLLSNIANGASTFDAPKGEGDKALKLANDGKWYEADKMEANGQAKADAQPVTKPKDVDKAGLVDFAKSNPNNAANIGDLQNLGWVVSASQTEGGYTDQVRNTNKVDFVGEGLAKVTGLTRNDGTREIKVSVQTGEVIGTNSEEPVLKGENGTEIPVIKIGDKYYKKSDLDQNTGLPTKEAKPLTTEELANVVNKQNKGAGLVTGNQVGDAIQNSGWNVGKATSEEVNKTTFNNNDGKAEKVNPNDNVRFSDGKNTVAKLGTVKVVDEHGVITTTTTVKVDVDSPIDFKYTDATGKEYVKANDGKFYAKDAVNADGSLKPVADPANAPTPLTDGEIAKLNKGAQLTNGSSNDGVANKAYEVKDPVQAAIQKAVADKLAENPKATSEEIARAVDVARAEAIKANPEAKDKITQGTGGIPLNNVGWATQPDQAVNKDQLDQTVNKAGFFVKQNGESTITGKDIEKVTPNDVVNFINGGNTIAKAETTRDEKTGQDRTDVSIHMTGLPVTYATKDGTPVTKVGDKFFKVNKDGYPIGDAVNVNELSTNLVNPAAPADKIGEPTVLGNVASGTNTIANKVDAKGNPLVQVGEGDTAKYYAPDQFDNGVLKADAKEAENPADATTPMHKAKDGLADLIHSNPNNALSVSDAKKLGFIVGAKDNEYADDVRNANVVEFVSGNDIATVTGETRKDGVREIKVTVSKNPVFETVQVGGKLGPKIGATQDGNIHIAKADGSPSRITNVAPGVNRNDAVNLGQLDDKIGDVHKRINKLDKGMRAGVAGATAVAFLQRPNEAGKSLVSLGVGNFKGQSAVAVGYSRNSDNNKISIKLGSGFNTNGDVNIGGSIGYQW